MQDLPFAKREPRVRAVTAPLKTRGAFDPAFEMSIPQNQQQIRHRQIQTGIFRQPGLKTSARIVDSRRDQLERNRENIFFDSQMEHNYDMKLPEPLTRSTRHMHCPYSYNTTWISHPDPNTSLYPVQDELFQTSFLKTPTRNIDSMRKKSHEESKFNSIRYNEQKFQEYVAQCDMKHKCHDDDTLNGIRNSRVNHLSALEDRRKREKIRFFE